MVDIGFVSVKDVTKYLSDKYIPDIEIKSKCGTLIKIKHNNGPPSTQEAMESFKYYEGMESPALGNFAP